MMKPPHKRRRQKPTSSSRVPKRASPYVKLSSSSSRRRYNRKRTAPKHGSKLQPIQGYRPPPMVQRAEYKFGVEQGIMYESKVSQDGSEFKVVSAILKREEELKSLESITANTYTRSLWVCDIAHALVRLKHYSLAVVEAIQLWRKPQTAPNPFFWEGENYLIKMFTDMVFLRSSRRVLVLIPFMLHANPLVQFDPDFLQRVSEWSPATRVLLGDANEVPKARLLNAEEVLLDELHRHCLKVTNTGHLEKVTKHSGNNNAQDQSSPMKKHKDDIFDCPMPGAHLFLAHRRHMLTTGSMKAAIELSNEVKELEKNLQTEKDRIGQIEEKIFSLERSLMFAAKEGLTMSISDVTEGNTSLLEQSIASAALQDFLGGKRLRENKTEHKKLCERLEMLKIELELRSEDASNQRERWNVKQKEDKEKKRRAKERRLKELERMGIRMSKGKAHPSLNEQMTVAKQKAKFDALSLATKNSKSPPKQPRVTFNLEDTKSIEQKQPKKAGEGTKRTSTPQQKHTENDTNSRPAPVQETPMEESQLKKPTIVFEDNSTMNTSLESNNMSGSLKESDIQHAKDIENVFLTAPNPIEASKLIKASPKNPFEKPKKSKVMDKTRSPKKQNNSSVLRSPKKKAQVGNMAVPVDLSAVDVHLFDNEIWKTVSGFLNPVERERFRQTNKDVFGYIENAVGKSFLVHDSIHYLQDKIDAKSVEARTSLDSIREISRDVQNLTDKDIKLLYLEAGKHDRVAKNVVDILILLGVTVSSTELLDATEVRRKVVFYDKQKLRKNVVKSLLPLIKENRSDLSRRKAQFSDDKNAEHFWGVLNVITNWCSKLCEYHHQYKLNVRKIDRMVDTINNLREKLVENDKQDYADGKDIDEILDSMSQPTAKDGLDNESSLLIDVKTDQ